MKCENRCEYGGNSVFCGTIEKLPPGNIPSSLEVITFWCPDHADKSQWVPLFREARSFLGTACSCTTCEARTHKGSRRAWRILCKLEGEGFLTQFVEGTE